MTENTEAQKGRVTCKKSLCSFLTNKTEASSGLLNLSKGDGNGVCIMKAEQGDYLGIGEQDRPEEQGGLWGLDENKVIKMS